MKANKLIALFLLAIASVFVNINSATAQTYTICTPDCDSLEWQPIETLVVQLKDCPTCFIRITYTWRDACNGAYQDLQILKIEKWNSSGTPALNCDACGDEQIYLEAVAAVIHQSDQPPMNWTPSEGNCDITYRVSSASCWATWEYLEYDDVTGQLTLKIVTNEPCESDCCLAPMTVCRDSLGGVTITSNSGTITQSSCLGKSFTPPFQSPVNCTGICGWLENIDEYYGKVTIGSPEMFERDPNSSSVKLNVSINESMLRVILEETSASNFAIVISSVNGSSVYNNTSKIITGTNTFDVDINNFNSGVYVYSIVLDGTIVKTGKFNISK